MSDLQIFQNEEFGSVRTVEENGKILFCGKDVAEALGYAVPRKALLDHCKGVLKRNTPTNGGIQEMSFIPEGDVYRLITHSKLPAAEKFESWVFDEILPDIRKHGAYMTPETLEEAIFNPDYLIKIVTALKEEKDKNKALHSDHNTKGCVFGVKTQPFVLSKQVCSHRKEIVPVPDGASTKLF